jgi:hypothetical protein
MSDLDIYVNNLFAKQKQTREVQDLKAEIRANLEAKKNDLIAGGMSEKEALEQAKSGITEVDSLISENMKIYINPFKQERYQRCLIYLLSAWLFTIPVSVYYPVGRISVTLFLISAGIGISYFVFQSALKKRPENETEYVNVKRYERMAKAAWIIWAVFILLCSLLTTAAYFSSNIWFGRSVSITGPYALGQLFVNYLNPFLTVLCPLSLGLNVRLAGKYEVRNDGTAE